MLIQQKIATIQSININNRIIDWLQLEWFETNKRILRKRTQSGREIALKFLNENQALTQDDVLYEDDKIIIAVEIIPCEVLVIQPASLFEMASICYEIGNKHQPLFFENDAVLVPFEMPLYRILTAQGYQLTRDVRKLLHPLKTTVAPHAPGNGSLFSRIMQLTNQGE